MADTGAGWLLRPPAATWRPVLRAGPGLAPSDLARMSAEGLVVAVAGGVHLLADLAGDPDHRALALAPLLPARGVAALAAAAWVHGVGSPPDPVDVLVPVSAGPAASAVEGVRLRCARLAAGDVVRVAGVPVTSPVRTATDLARAVDAGSAAPLLAGLLAAGVPPEQVRSSLAGARHAARGRRSLAAARAGQEPCRDSSAVREPVSR